MTYPQPSLATQVATGQKQIRLMTQVSGAGEIYELDAGAVAYSLGPECDFAQINIGYYDPSNPPSLCSQSRLTPFSPLIAQIDQRPDQKYPLSNRKGRTFVSLLDIYGSQYVPIGFTNGSDVLNVEKAVLDIIGWLTPPPAVPFKRSDKLFKYQEHPLAAAAHLFWRVIPTYGRKYAFIDFFNNSGGAVNFTVRGVNFTTVANGDPTQNTPRDDQEKVLIALGAVGNGATTTQVVKASTDGQFDALAIGIGNAGGTNITNAPLSIYVSDDNL